MFRVTCPLNQSIDRGFWGRIKIYDDICNIKELTPQYIITILDIFQEWNNNGSQKWFCIHFFQISWKLYYKVIMYNNPFDIQVAKISSNVDPPKMPYQTMPRSQEHLHVSMRSITAQPLRRTVIFQWTTPAQKTPQMFKKKLDSWFHCQKKFQNILEFWCFFFFNQNILELGILLNHPFWGVETSPLLKTIAALVSWNLYVKSRRKSQGLL